MTEEQCDVARTSMSPDEEDGVTPKMVCYFAECGPAICFRCALLLLKADRNYIHENISKK